MYSPFQLKAKIGIFCHFNPTHFSSIIEFDTKICSDIFICYRNHPALGASCIYSWVSNRRTVGNQHTRGQIKLKLINVKDDINVQVGNKD